MLLLVVSKRFYLIYCLQNPDLADQLLPFMMSLMVDSSLRTYTDKLPEDDMEEELMTVGHKHAQEFMDMLATDKVAFALSWCYLLSLLKQKDKYVSNSYNLGKN